MNVKKILLSMLSAALVAASVLSFSSCGDQAGTAVDGTSVVVTESGEKLVLRDAMNRDNYGADTAVGAWLAGCSAEDRDDHFEAYTLRSAKPTEDGHTTFTYVVYYPHGGEAVLATPSLAEESGGYVLELRYKAGKGVADYSLCSLTVTLPTDEAPRLRLLVGEETLGVLSTVSDQDITLREGDS